MSLTLLGEESPQFVCLEHPESCILNKLPKPLLFQLILLDFT